MKTTLIWAIIVEDYSSRSLTFGKDKLPALAGLAQKVQEESKHTYIAGLWFETLAWDLLWSARAIGYQYEKPRQSKALLDSAPSWSWASVDGTVEIMRSKENYPITDMTQHAFVLGVEGLPSGKAAFGCVLGAVLNIECEVLIPVQPEHPSWDAAQLCYTRFHDRKPFTFWPKLDYNDVTEGVKYILPLHTRIESTSPGKYIHGYALSNPKNSQILIEGLILEQTGRSLGDYRRIGVFYPEFKSEAEVQNWNELMKTLPPDLKETDYERRYIDEKTGNERCTIKII